ncbi:kinase-like domain-containing protein, partial [Thelonectria olida]
APYFTRPQSGVNHYVFDLATVLPFKKQSQPASRAEISNSVKNTEGGQGGYGTVRRTTLHLSHHHFSDYGTSSEPGVVAIKQLDSHNRADFQKEIDALLPFSHRNDKQLVKLLATYEVLDDNVSTFYLIFPWAEANLRSLWHTHEKGGDTVYNLHWISGQALAIAKALEYMHEDYAKTFSDDPNSFDKQRFGRHGDIKAANFLVFQRNKEVLIFLADFGLSRFYRQKTRSMEPPKAMSPSYRPPECDTTGGTLSRKSDIWSLGAFFLEFLTWYLKGWKGVSIEFPDFREAPDLEDGRGLVSDIFFTIRVEGNIKTAVVKEKVHRWISRLHSSKASTQFVHDMLDLVQEKMLVVDKEKRITAGDLRKALQSIHEKCEKKENYLTPGRPYDEKKAK